MGFGKFLKRARKKLKGFFKRGGGGDPRSEAASQLIRENVKRQAGAGQISFTEERRV